MDGLPQVCIRAGLDSMPASDRGMEPVGMTLAARSLQGEQADADN